MNSRILVALVAGLAIGLLIGRAAPLADLRTLRAELEEARKKGGGRSVGRTAMAGVESMLKVNADEVAQARRARPRPGPEVAVAVSTNAEAVSTGVTVEVRGPPWRDREGGRGRMSNQIEQVKQAWQLRSEIARKNFIERAKLDTTQAADLDVVLEAMNLRLGDTIDRWAAKIRAADSFSPETGIRMMNELSQTLVVTYDEMDRKLSPTWRESAGEDFELVRFVDPEVLTPLQDLEPVMSRGGPRLDEDVAADEVP